MSALFITGATGFVGRHVLAALADHGAQDVRCLVRREGSGRTTPAWRSEWREFVGDLFQPERYEAALGDDVSVLHLAGVAGKGPRKEFQRHNVEGTRVLLSACRRKNVSHFVYVSSIAATYPDLARYPYGESKWEAEREVAGTALPYSIVRPTMVFGPGSPNQQALERLALLPAPLMFGSGQVEVQPIHVRDLARLLVIVLTAPATGKTQEVGGPDVLTLDALFQLIRLIRGSRQRPSLHLPLAPLRVWLSIMEPVFRPVLPFSEGQLAAFSHPSRARPVSVDSPGASGLERSRFIGIRQMIEHGREEPR